MSNYSLSADKLSQFYSQIYAFLPTEILLVLFALIPIYAGSHASLSRPSSAAPQARPVSGRRHRRNEDDDEKKVEGLTLLDALLLPVGTGCVLVGLYFLIQWLQDPAIISTILNAFMSFGGLLGTVQFLNDAGVTIASFAFPERYADGETIWELVPGEKAFKIKDDEHQGSERRTSPLPLALKLPSSIESFLWRTRFLLLEPMISFKVTFPLSKDSKPSTVELTPLSFSTYLFTVLSMIYFNLVAKKPWLLTNLVGLSASYFSLQLLSPTTFTTGTLLLSVLFFYDIYFVFFTPIMIKVATTLDIPAKVLAPRFDAAESSKHYAMLGLGDIVLPGLMIAMALRFDLYVHYRRLQRSVKDDSDASKPFATKVIKAPYVSATGSWGERFHLRGSTQIQSEGGTFKKTYFHAAICAYVAALLLTSAVMIYFEHGQPALLYLVPGVLCTLWGVAAWKGEARLMWAYDEEDDGKETKSKEEKKEKDVEKKEKRKDGTKNKEKPKVEKTAEDENDALFFTMDVRLPRQRGEHQKIIEESTENGTSAENASGDIDES